MLEFFAIAALLQLIEEFSELFVGHVGHTPLGGTPAAPTEGADGNRFCQLHPARQDRRHAVMWSAPPGSPSFAMSAAADGSQTARQSERILFGEIRSPARKWQRHAPSPSRRYDVRAQDAETGLSVLVRHSLDEACRHFSCVWLRSHADHRIFAFALALLIIGLAQRLSSLWATRLT
jgi:hypothetical protein